MDTSNTTIPCQSQSEWPLSLLIVMTCLAGLGSIYSLSLIMFNVVLRKHKMVKMTSPNINVIILTGTIVGYGSMVTAGLDSSTVSNTSATMQASAFLVVCASTLIYGSLFAKVCRVFLIFSNLSFNGKTFRDEHILLVVASLLLLDLVILLPWQFADPITCRTWQTLQQSAEHGANVTSLPVWSCSIVEACSSRLQTVWISVLYIYKFIVLASGVYFTWNTRQVTLPALKDAIPLAAVLLIVATMSLTALPALLTVSDSADSVSLSTTVTRYAVCCLALWFALITSVSVLFMPKVLLVRRYNRHQKERPASVEDTQMQFSESIRTNDSMTSCWPCLTSAESRSTGDDQYAVQVLASEIQTLKRTIKEKDTTIRELTDRLYVGAEQFQRYLTSPSRARDYRAATVTRSTSSNAVYPASATGGELTPANGGVQRTYSDDYDDDDDDSSDDNDVMTSPSSMPARQLDIVNTMTSSTAARQDDGAYDNPSLMRGGSTTDLVTSWNPTDVAAVSKSTAVIHCRPIAATSDDFPNSDDRVTSSTINSDRRLRYGAGDGGAVKQFAVYQI